MSVALENVLFELICFTVFVSICAGLLRPRFSRGRGALILAGSVAVAAAIQFAMLCTASNAVALILTWLPFTAYLPVIVAVHILAEGGFATAVATWCMGLLAPYTLNLLRELFREIWNAVAPDSAHTYLLLLSTLGLGALLVFAAVRFCRKPFQMYEFQDRYVWLIVPVVLLFSLISYLESMTYQPFATLVLFLIVLVMFAFLIKFLNVAMSEQLARTSEQEIARQLDAQRLELLRIDQKMEQGRIYRHDMRHHLSVLHELASDEKNEDIRAYISSLDSRISDVEREQYCGNTAVNAVLTTYIGRAKQEGVRTEVKVDIPQEPPIDTFDICTVLANALNNAVTACCHCREERWVQVSAVMHEGGNLSVDLKNSCDTPVEFGRDGLPVSHGGEEHGFGVKSIDAIVKKYNGLLRCTCEGGVFRLSAVLFSPRNIPSAEGTAAPVKRLLSNTAALLLLGVCLLNFLPDTMQAAAAVPALSGAVRLLDFRTTFSWGSSALRMEAPVDPEPSSPDLPPELPDGAGEMERQMEDYLAEIEADFLYNFSRKYHGYVASDTGYNILRDDERLLCLQYYTTVNMGGSDMYSRCFTLDKQSGTVIQLADLFIEGSDYVGVISADVLRQMEERVATGLEDYFIPGGIFSDEECFQAIDAEQNFYIDEAGKLVIVFDKYEVAPGSTGAPQFTVEPETLREILRQPSLLTPVGKEPI